MIKDRAYTILYSAPDILHVQSEVTNLTINNEGRVIIPSQFKENKTILAVIEGTPNILNVYGDRLEELRAIIHDSYE